MTEDDIARRTRACTGCRRTFPATLEFFYKHPSGKFGLFPRCKECDRARRRRYYRTPAGQAASLAWAAKPENRVKLREAGRRHYRTDAGKAAVKARNSKQCYKNYQRKWAEENRDKIAAAEQRRRESPEYLEKKRRYQAEFARRRRRNNPAAKEYQRDYNKRPEVRKKRAKQQHQYVRRRLKVDGEYALRFKTRRHILAALKGSSDRVRKGWWWESACGYSVEELRQHLERQFVGEMSWDNHGSVWQIDHIKPLAAFVIPDAECPAFREAWALSNLRPLCKRLNNAKGALLAHP